MKIAIIGSGPCGLSLMHAFRNLEKQDESSVPEIVCFEKQSQVGGLWNYTWRTGLDENGEPIHNSQYRHLWTNAPKECLEFADYSFFEHFGKAIPSFPPREVLRDYIMGRLHKNGVLDNSSKKISIKFNTIVKEVQLDKENNKYLIRSFDSTTKEMSSSDGFDRLVIATGHFSKPNLPEFPGFASFQGTIIHAHDFRNASAFKDQRVLVVGSSFSAEDIALQLMKFEAKKVTISYRNRAMGFDWPATIEEMPILTSVDGKTVHFSNGETREIDAIVLCTGYQMNHNFLPKNIRLESPNTFYPKGLYKGVVWNRDPRVLYLGMQNEFFTFTMFDVQAWFARDFLIGKIKLPTEEEREQDMESWLERMGTLACQTDFVRYQMEYVKDLKQFSDYPDWDLDQIFENFRDWEQKKIDNILTYRENCYKSGVSGHMAPQHSLSWLEAKDDSMKVFLESEVKA